MFKANARDVARMAYRVKGHLHNAYTTAVKWESQLDKCMHAGRIASQIVAPHIGEGVHKNIKQWLSQYEKVRDAVRQKHDTALEVASDIKSKALPALGI